MRATHLNKTLIVVTTLLLSACVGVYTPQKDAPQATLHMVHDLPHLTIASWHYFPDLNCEEYGRQPRLASFSALYDQEKRVQLAAGRKMYLRVSTYTQFVRGGTCPEGETCNATCTVLFEANPVAGKTYRAQHVGDGARCDVSIFDEATGRRATEFQSMSVPANCQRKPPGIPVR